MSKLNIDLKEMNEKLKKSGVYDGFKDQVEKSEKLKVKKVSVKIDLDDPIFKNVTKTKTTIGKIFGEQIGSNVLVNCENPECHNQRWVKIADLKRGYGRFCGKSCAGACREALRDEESLKKQEEKRNQKQVELDERKKNAKVGDEISGEVLVCCENKSCKNTRWSKKADLKRGYGRFCSKSCAKIKN